VNKPILILLIALVVALFAAGCGGGGSDSAAGTDSAANTSTETDGTSTTADSTSATPLTRAEFIKQGDAICTQIDTEQEAALKAALKKDPEAQTAKANQEKLLTEAGLPPIQNGIEELASLAPPSGDEVKAEAIVSGIEEGLKDSEEDPGILLSPATDPFVKAGKLAGEYGFKVCSTPG
jgi:hypothetical protein